MVIIVSLVILIIFVSSMLYFMYETKKMDDRKKWVVNKTLETLVFYDTNGKMIAKVQPNDSVQILVPARMVKITGGENETLEESEGK